MAAEWAVINTATLWTLSELTSSLLKPQVLRYTMSRWTGLRQETMSAWPSPAWTSSRSSKRKYQLVWVCFSPFSLVMCIKSLRFCVPPAWAACFAIPRSRFESALDLEPESFSSILRFPSRRASQWVQDANCTFSVAFHVCVFLCAWFLLCVCALGVVALPNSQWACHHQETG